MEGREPCPAVPYTYIRKKSYSTFSFTMQMYIDILQSINGKDSRVITWDASKEVLLPLPEQ